MHRKLINRSLIISDKVAMSIKLYIEIIKISFSQLNRVTSCLFITVLEEFLIRRLRNYGYQKYDHQRTKKQTNILNCLRLKLVKFELVS